jgi:hypothetical protein
MGSSFCTNQNPLTYVIKWISSFLASDLNGVTDRQNFTIYFVCYVLWGKTQIDSVWEQGAENVFIYSLFKDAVSRSDYRK